MECQSSIPLGFVCLNCKRYFLQNEKLPLQSMTIQFKNYPFPIKQKFLKHTLLRTIVAFLNSKGGTIFIGVDDETGQVIGMYLNRKQMDQFRLVIKQMLEKVQPAVDLIKSEQVSVQFIPILEGKQKAFYGKYIIKIIVLQGDVSKLYCISQKISSMNGKLTEYDVIYSFKRHNLGGIQDISGIQVIHQIYQKATKPYRRANTFHQGCNPSPIVPQCLQRPQKQKRQSIFSIFAKDQQNKIEMTNKNQNSKSPKNNSDSQTIIDKIKIVQLKGLQQKYSDTEESYPLFFDNIKPQMLKSFSNYLKNSTSAKFSKNISINKYIVEVEFATKVSRQVFFGEIQQSKMKTILQGFGQNQKIFVSIINPLKRQKIEQQKKSINRQLILQQQAQPNQIYKYLIIFKDYYPKFQNSLQNYLQKCISKAMKRRLKKYRNHVIQLSFKQKYDRNRFYDLCKQPPHINQLNQYGIDRKIRIKLDKKEDRHRYEKREEVDRTYERRRMNENQNMKKYQSGYNDEQAFSDEQAKNMKKNKISQQKNKIQEEQADNLSKSCVYPSIQSLSINPCLNQQYPSNSTIYNPPVKIQEQHSMIRQQTNYHQNQHYPQLSSPENQSKVKTFSKLILSCIQPSQYINLYNYLCKLNIGISRKMRVSELRYYIQILFQEDQNKDKFLKCCHEQPHRSLMSQFFYKKKLIIGEIGQQLLIYPYNQECLQVLRTMILNCLGRGIIRSSAIMDIKDSQQKYWVLILIDKSNVLRYYQRLENMFKNKPVMVNGHQLNFRVMLNYKNS